MRNLVRVAGLGVALAAFGVMAFGTKAKTPTCDVAPAPAVAPAVADTQVSALVSALEAREAELQRVRAELSLKDDTALYEEAVALGIVDAVKASRLPAHQQRRVAVAIVREARLNEVDPLLVVAVIRTESSFNNYAVSHVGAMGLMQVMPATGHWLVERRGGKLGRTSNLFDSELNIQLGTWYLAEMIEQFGSVEKALVAYNAGPGGAKKILRKPHIRKRFMAGYPAKVMGEFNKLKRDAETRMAVQVQHPVPNERG